MTWLPIESANRAAGRLFALDNCTIQSGIATPSGFRVLDTEDNAVTSTTILYCLISLLAGSALTFGLFKLNQSKLRAKLRQEADQILEVARRQGEADRSQLLLDAKEAALAAKAAAEEEIASVAKVASAA